MKKLFLCSYFAAVADLLKEFIDEDLVGKKVAFIPTAGNVEKMNFFIGTAKKAFDRLGMLIEEIDVSVCNEEQFTNVLGTTDYIYVSGGNTFFLLQELQRNGLDKILVEYIEQGKPYIGESAGAIIASPNLEYIKAVNFDPISKAPELQSLKALGIIDSYIVPHFGEFPFKKKAEKINQLFGEQLPLININNKQAIILKGDSLKVNTIVK